MTKRPGTTSDNGFILKKKKKKIEIRIRIYIYINIKEKKDPVGGFETISLIICFRN